MDLLTFLLSLPNYKDGVISSFENDRKMRLFYRKYGDPKNKPIVVIFGLLGVSENWDFFGKRFAELGDYKDSATLSQEYLESMNVTASAEAVCDFLMMFLYIVLGGTFLAAIGSAVYKLFN